MKKKKFNTLANQITVLRLFLVPPIVIGLIEKNTAWVIALLSISLASDFLDGRVARLRGEKTQLGAMLDPIADKVLLTAVFMTLALQGVVEMWLFVIVFSRDLMIVLGWLVIYILTGEKNISPRVLGKVTTAVQMATALSCFLPIPWKWHPFFVWPTVVVTVASAVDYVIVGEKRLGGL